jgi:2-keto-4-pentenoate hydratase/2-oxohepta-3-ene-1,7-dioic acid hydratase in catechol pathway
MVSDMSWFSSRGDACAVIRECFEETRRPYRTYAGYARAALRSHPDAALQRRVHDAQVLLVNRRLALDEASTIPIALGLVPGQLAEATEIEEDPVPRGMNISRSIQAYIVTRNDMRFCVFEGAPGGHHLAADNGADGEYVVDLTAAWPAARVPAPRDVADLARLGDAGLETARRLAAAADAVHLKVADLKLLAPIPRPRRNVFCVGRNYREHIIEGNIAQGRDPHAFPEHIELFTKATTTVTGPRAPIPLHAELTRMLDYEAELGIVIGKGGNDIDESRGLDAVFGYTIVNDVSARDLQRRHGQWFKGKSLDGSCPMGPWVVHKSALGDPHALGIRLWVNGELRQDGNTGSMLFGIPAIVSLLSAGLTLEPGDIIATGTPSGVGYAMKPPRPLRDGDSITIEIDGIGRLENTVRGRV